MIRLIAALIVISINIQLNTCNDIIFESTTFDKVYIFSPTYVNLSDADKYCKNRNGQLWEPMSQDEQDFIISKIEQLEPSRKAWDWIWLGISESSNQFMSGQKIKWSNWATNRNHADSTAGKGVIMNRNYSPKPKWDETYSSGTHHVLCERNSIIQQQRMLRQFVESLVVPNNDQLTTIRDHVSNNSDVLGQCSSKVDLISNKLSEFRDQTTSKLVKLEIKNGRDQIKIMTKLAEIEAKLDLQISDHVQHLERNNTNLLREIDILNNRIDVLNGQKTDLKSRLDSCTTNSISGQSSNVSTRVVNCEQMLVKCQSRLDRLYFENDCGNGPKRATN